MSNKLLLASLLVTSFATLRHAAAAPLPRAEIGVNGKLGGAVGQLATATSIEGDVRITGGSLYAHGALASGSFDDLSEAIGSEGSTPFYQGSGTFHQARIGVESLRCSSSGRACGVFGLDLGVLRTSDTTGPRTDSPTSHYTQEQLVPRLGLDAGGTHVRVRLFGELAMGAAQRETPALGMKTSLAGGQGFMLGAGVAYRF